MARSPARRWLADVTAASWTGPADIKATYAAASFLAGNRVVFNIKANDYRLIVVVEYRARSVFVRWMGTHSEYDKIDAGTV
ncbi:MAG: type II toxin-antitoxin system HigB family toxin [Deltaproteobacteria bacterium]|nr:type II toxin-antitoxin system HigB family toxin [Deltaproteobacteria bacterium]